MDSAASEPEETDAGGSGGAPRVALGKGRALVTVPAAPASKSSFPRLGRTHGMVAAGVAVVLGLGFVAGTEVFASKPQPVKVAQIGPAPDPTLEMLVRVQGEVRSLKASLDGLRASSENSRQDETIRGLKRSVDTLKGDLDGVKTASTAAVGQLGAKIDKIDRDPGPKLAEIAARLDKLDRDPSAKLAEVTAKLDKLDPAAKLAEVTARLERVERQVASADATGSIPSPATAPTPAKVPVPPQRVATASPTGPSMTATAPTPAPPARPEAPRPEVAAVQPHADTPAKVEAPARPQEAAAKPGTVEGWMLRDVYGGVALLEGRAGLREVAPGEFLPGVGEIRSIERRGRGWVVVTSRGIIQADNRW
ncbi:MAG: hypothetical protein ACRYGP_03710 [Janthinobacterium lividum]